jgi:hypothetical protein
VSRFRRPGRSTRVGILKPLDWLRILVLVAGFGALTWAVVNRYSGNSLSDAYRKPLRAFFAAARARDSVRLRSMVTAEAPLRWAVSAGSQIPSPIPAAGDRIEVQGAEQNGDTTTMMVWAVTACGRQPFFITMVNRAGRSLLLDLRTECDSTRKADSATPP